MSGSPSWPSTLGAGVYDSDTDPTLLEGPIWTSLDLEPDDEWVETIELDLRHSVVTTTMRHPSSSDEVTVRRFASAVRPGVCALRVSGPRRSVRRSPPLVAPDGRSEPQTTSSDHAATLLVRGPVGSIAAVAHTDVVDDVAPDVARSDGESPGVESSGTRIVTRIVALGAEQFPSACDGTKLRAAAQQANAAGFDRLEAEHREKWADRWQRCGTEIEGDAELDIGLRFATYTLLGVGADERELAIGARGLTGFGYRGHVFWDTDVFVTPALSALEPRAARATLVYRWARLDAARARARAEGFEGARFPWESARTGEEVTPSEWRDLHGVARPILTGRLEEHIVADVAWAVMRYFRWTNDWEFMRAMGNELLLETARYWASRIEVDADGSGHIRNVIGPDEYHDGVDDNAFTNAMVRWNLRAAAPVCRGAGTIDHAAYRRWMGLADALVDGYDERMGTYEQFAGYHDLEPVMASDVGTPPMPADALLGSERIRQTQIVKQPDVLMMYALLDDELVPGSLAAALDHYLPRTAHGSSLSPATCAALLARVGRLDEAQHWFRWAVRLDLDNRDGTTAGGLHLATIGGVWQAMTSGFFGVREHEGGLLLDPRLPPSWGRVRHRFSFRGATVSIEADGDVVRVDCSQDVSVGVADGTRRRRHHAFRRTTQGWTRR